MSSLRRLCFVLPMDGDEVILEDEDGGDDEPRPRRNRKLTGSVRRKVGRAISSCGLRCCGGHRGDFRSAAAGFEDIDGVYDDEAGDGGNDRKIKGGGPRVFSYSELYIGTSGFSDAEVLGSGGFGRVYRAVLPSDGTTVAVKRVVAAAAAAGGGHGQGKKKGGGGGGGFEKSFVAELSAVARLRHRNLVRLRGWCVRELEEELLLVYDYMPNRSLDRLLFSSSAPSKLDWGRRRRIVAGLAAALLYLHEQLDTQIIHRDVKASNVMLDAGYNARLGDFGLARWLEHDATPPMAMAMDQQLLPSPSFASSGSKSNNNNNNYQFRLIDTSRIGGTIGYLPPESFQRRAMAATAKSDVFSFGIVLLEVATGRRAVDLTFPDDQIFMLDWARRLADQGKLLDAGDRKLLLLEGGHGPGHEDMGRLVHLGLLCSLHDPRSRPTMKWVVENLSGSSCSADLPPLPSFSALPNYISLTSSSSDSSDSGTTTTTTTCTTTTIEAGTTSTTSNSMKPPPMYATADGATVYLTAEEEQQVSSSASGEKSGVERSPSRAVVPNVDTPREISYAEIVAMTKDFSASQVVAELDFGTAYEGFLEDDDGHHRHRQHVLVKRLGMKTCPALRVRFANELRNVGQLRHRNLVRLRGWCTDHGEMLVVYDHSPGTSLLSHHLLSRQPLPWRQRQGVATALASAVLYLHEEWDERVIHRNITSSAVFLDGGGPDRDGGSPRLGSFALAEFLSRNERHNPHVAAALPSASARGIFGYMAPEYMESGEATTMADVYSFGVVLLEVVTGGMAVDARTPEVLLVRKVRQQLGRRGQDQEEDVVVLEALADRRLDGRFDRRELLRMARLAVACTASDPAARPGMREVVGILDGNDEALRKLLERRTERSREEWDAENKAALALVRRLQALGIH
ncbi:receptor like protein kinase S.2 [Brachypodium distachyon]|uniref:Protein kinase domain-containing protein n=1 Tax=Brachypodium distachyon TaxID=15368 RepID=I1IIS8_BRADI|nr:receptor like protein kinase S.2 [Brachypodium distachyon]KQJ86911.1 hypothetical protein BRADI_4g08410v3 [Brachypodium distachyon]|eukprot:XP_010237315.1 receptor like protein kinase S.2 [Brachypodium distachyon]